MPVQLLHSQTKSQKLSLLAAMHQPSVKAYVYWSCIHATHSGFISIDFEAFSIAYAELLDQISDQSIPDTTYKLKIPNGFIVTVTATPRQKNDWHVLFCIPGENSATPYLFAQFTSRNPATDGDAATARALALNLGTHTMLPIETFNSTHIASGQFTDSPPSWVFQKPLLMVGDNLIDGRKRVRQMLSNGTQEVIAYQLPRSGCIGTMRGVLDSVAQNIFGAN